MLRSGTIEFLNLDSLKLILFWSWVVLADGFLVKKIVDTIGFREVILFLSFFPLILKGFLTRRNTVLVSFPLQRATKLELLLF